MPISVSCPSCGKAYIVKDEARGVRFLCKECGAVTHVSAAAATLPAVRETRRPERGREYAFDRVHGPAGALQIVTAFSLIVCVLAAIVIPIVLALGNGRIQPEAVVRLVVQLVWCVVVVIVCSVILYGASRMKRLESYRWAMTAAAVSTVPCLTPCFVLNIGFGVWALIVLSDPDVKAAFAQQARDDRRTTPASTAS
ncbi:MAG: TFIIB-type zinc ribbon-containing protein [Planctomycetota bacterium]|nr:MAG: TFIIB-type zinc ribbon-containing protein [Planctomycetota bacterium]